MTDVEICNLALSRVGSSMFISAMDGTSQEAIHCNRAYLPTLKRVLQEIPWPFLSLSVTLADVSDNVKLPTGWAYAYDYPDDALKIRCIDPAEQKIPFAVSRVENSTTGIYTTPVVLTNIPEATATVTYYEEGDEANYPQYFLDVLAWAVAAEIALPLRAAADIYRVIEQKYRLALFDAAANSFNEGREAEPTCELLRARL